MSATTDSSSHDYVNVLEARLNVAQTVSLEKTKRHENSTSEDTFLSTKSSKCSNKMEKCLLVVTAVQSVLLAVAIICMALAYFKCNEVEKKLAHFSNSKGFENANCSFLDNHIKVIKQETHTVIREINMNISAVLTVMTRQISHVNNSQEVLADNVSLLNTKLNEYQESITTTIFHTNNATRFLLEQVRKESNLHKTNVIDATENKIYNVTMKVIEDVRALHIFSSCEDIGNLSILFPAGVYRVRSSKCSFVLRYCNANTTVLCNGVAGLWKSIAYLNTNQFQCPDGFELRSDTSNPPLCGRTNTSAGCSSVIYPSNGISYSQVCGTVRVHPAGTPDGFHTFNDESIDVDGVSLSYGNGSSRNHIWTYTAATLFGTDSRGCDICNDERPSFPGTNYTCTTTYCNKKKDCYPNTLWCNNAQQCFGNETFYRQLSESTTDNIEMRVCRDQPRSDEDILISSVELFVL